MQYLSKRYCVDICARDPTNVLIDTYQRISGTQGPPFGHKCEHIDPMQLAALLKIALPVAVANGSFCPSRPQLRAFQQSNFPDPDEGRWAV